MENVTNYDLEYNARVARLTMVVAGLLHQANGRNVAAAVLSNPINIGGVWYAIDDSDLIDTPFADIRRVVSNKMRYLEPKKFKKEQRLWDKENNNE